jgi:predicted nucleotidyltransferase
LVALRLRDRDAIITREGLIFRVFGYSHPPDAYICDVEYAPSEIFRSNNPKAFRSKGHSISYKFYEDEGLKFVRRNYPTYLISHGMLGTSVVGVRSSDIVRVEKPDEKLAALIETEPKDTLTAALHNVLQLIAKCSRLSVGNFGVFGSILHDFYHPRFSDLDFVVYGRENAIKLRETLQELYEDRCSSLKNEFESDEQVERKHWNFKNYSSKEYLWHQQRKMIYALFSDEKSGRIIKTEFEPVKDWKEIRNEYDAEVRILQKGWVKMFAHISEDSDACFIPSIYGIEPQDVLSKTDGADDVRRIVSYMEEFRMQAYKDEKVYVEGNLEEVITPNGTFHQIALTYCPRYYEQVLKIVS